MKFRTYRKWKARRHMMGHTENSPFVSVLEDFNAGAKSTDPWLRTIITGKPGLPGVEKAPNLATFRVPNERLHYPEPDMLLQLKETERLFLGDDLADYMTKLQENPF